MTKPLRLHLMRIGMIRAYCGSAANATTFVLKLGPAADQTLPTTVCKSCLRAQEREADRQPRKRGKGRKKGKSGRSAFICHFDSGGASFCNYTDRIHAPTLVSDWDLVDCKWCRHKANTEGEDAELPPPPNDRCRLCNEKAHWQGGWYAGLCADCAIHEVIRTMLRLDLGG